jgi:hypothetical protein
VKGFSATLKKLNRSLRTVNYSGVAPTRRTFNELTFPHPFAISRETREKGKMKIFNEEVTRGIRTANFASVRVFSGG